MEKGKLPVAIVKVRSGEIYIESRSMEEWLEVYVDGTDEPEKPYILGGCGDLTIALDRPVQGRIKK